MRKIIDSIVSVLLYITGGLCYFIMAPLLLILSFFHTGALFEGFIKIICKSLMFCLGIRVKLEGAENFDPQKQYIIMMNHVNLFDGFLFYSKYPGKARAVEEESHFQWPLYGRLITKIGFIPINRKSGIKAMAALEKAGQLIRERHRFSVVVMPEGTRTLTGKLGNFKKGGFLVAMEAGLDILPVVQIGSGDIKRKNHWLIRPGKVRLLIEKPIPTSEYNKDNVSELMNKTRNLFLEYVD
ncbi:MAG: 1-acyl-sn-glycerol-3-phosphate acyltransferase [bacterium]|nr:1-acyl-sn-glycerol-3-phosphate acyltransferase [bacterium]